VVQQIIIHWERRARKRRASERCCCGSLSAARATFDIYLGAPRVTPLRDKFLHKLKVFSQKLLASGRQFNSFSSRQQYQSGPTNNPLSLSLSVSLSLYYPTRGGNSIFLNLHGQHFALPPPAQLLLSILLLTHTRACMQTNTLSLAHTLLPSRKQEAPTKS
jgi:hypothetical protein